MEGFLVGCAGLCGVVGYEEEVFAQVAEVGEGFDGAGEEGLALPEDAYDDDGIVRHMRKKGKGGRAVPSQSKRKIWESIIPVSFYSRPKLENYKIGKGKVQTSNLSMNVANSSGFPLSFRDGIVSYRIVRLDKNVEAKCQV